MLGEIDAGVAVGIILVGFGGLVAVSGLRYRSTAARLAAASPIDDGSSGDLVVAKGHVEGPTAGHTLESQLAGTECVAYAYDVTEIRSANPEENVYEALGTYSTDVSDGEGAVPFTLTVNGGNVRVEADDALFEWRPSDFDSVSPSQVGRTGGLFRLVVSILRQLSEPNRRREYYEATLCQGDAVRVVGTLGEDGKETTVSASGGPLVVSTNENGSLDAPFRRTFSKRFRVGLLGIGAGVFALLLATGIL